MREEIMIPNAPILMESTRAVGYSFESALADIIDNSLSKASKKIDVFFDSSDHPFVAIVDDGEGMTEKELKIAMNYGSKSSLETRDANDLGRFGLGLKMASLSQCRCVTVITKKNNKISAAKWDLDYVIKKNNWSALFYEINDIKDLSYSDYLNDYTSGTVVVWEKFDKLERETSNFQKSFDEKIELSMQHVALVFHRFMDDENFNNKVKIYFNNEAIIPLDPFLISNPATQPLTEQNLTVENHEIKVKPFILPIASKLKQSDIKKLGGDINDLRQNQGFYVYRNKRLIIWGTWFRLIKNYELSKLTRVRVDIPNTLDDIWNIDIKKSSASLPDIVKKNLVSIVENAVGRSERVYKYRGRKATTDDLQHIWNVVDNRGKFQYLVNKDIPLYKQLESCLNEDDIRYLDSFIKSLEEAFPYPDVYYRMAKNENSIQKASLEFEEAYRVGLDMIDSIKSMGGDVEALLFDLDKIDFFSNYPDVVKKLREDYKND